MEPDLVAINGRIVTMDKKMSVVGGIAIFGGRIFALGNTSEVSSLIGPNTKVVDLERKTALPGFIDAHYHLELASRTLGLMAQCHTPPNRTIDDVIRRLQEWEPNVPAGQWIIGQGCLVQERKLKDQRFPNRHDLDKVSRTRPVALRFGMHVTILNTKALELLGIRKDTLPPRGASFDKDSETGEPTGVTRDFWSCIPLPGPSEEQMSRAIRDHINDFCLPNGLTSIHDLPDTTLALKIYQKLFADGELPIRIRFFYEVPHMINIDPIIGSGLGKGFGNDFLRLGGIKIFTDGGVTSAGACFHEPYDFDKNRYGALAMSEEEIKTYVLKANEIGLQVLLHAVGDRATDIALDAVERAQQVCFRPDHRHRIEHMGNVYPQLHRFQRAKELGALPVPNMGFINSWGDQVEYLVGKERGRSAFWCKTLMDQGFQVPGSSDATGTHPENTNPFFCISCAVNRKSFSGRKISPGEGISMTQAIRMYTNYSAYAGFEENEKGSLEVGKLGDLIILSRDPWDVGDSEIAEIRILCTIVGGKIAYNPAGF